MDLVIWLDKKDGGLQKIEQYPCIPSQVDPCMAMQLVYYDEIIPGERLESSVLCLSSPRLDTSSSSSLSLQAYLALQETCLRKILQRAGVSCADLLPRANTNTASRVYCTTA